MKKNEAKIQLLYSKLLSEEDRLDEIEESDSDSARFVVRGHRDTQGSSRHGDTQESSRHGDTQETRGHTVEVSASHNAQAIHLLEADVLFNRNMLNYITDTLF